MLIRIPKASVEPSTKVLLQTLPSQPICLGVLNNRKPNSTELLNDILPLLKKQLAISEVIWIEKDAQHSAGEAKLSSLAEKCDVVLLSSAD